MKDNMFPSCICSCRSDGPNSLDARANEGRADSHRALFAFPVFPEFLLPLGVAYGRQHPTDGFPLGNAQTRLGEPREAADDDDREREE